MTLSLSHWAENHLNKLWMAPKPTLEIEQIITIKIVRCSYCEISMQKPLNCKTIVVGLCRDPSRLGDGKSWKKWTSTSNERISEWTATCGQLMNGHNGKRCKRWVSWTLNRAYKQNDIKYIVTNTLTFRGSGRVAGGGCDGTAGHCKSHLWLDHKLRKLCPLSAAPFTIPAHSVHHRLGISGH